MTNVREVCEKMIPTAAQRSWPSSSCFFATGCFYRAAIRARLRGGRTHDMWQCIPQPIPAFWRSAHRSTTWTPPPRKIWRLCADDTIAALFLSNYFLRPPYPMRASLFLPSRRCPATVQPGSSPYPPHASLSRLQQMKMSPRKPFCGTVTVVRTPARGQKGSMSPEKMPNLGLPRHRLTAKLLLVRGQSLRVHDSHGNLRQT